MTTLRILITTLLLYASAGMADPFVGQFSGYSDGDQLTLSLSKDDAGNYAGSIAIEGESIPLAARRQGDQLVGEINEFGDIYGFVAFQRDDGALYLEDEDGDGLLFTAAGSAAPVAAANPSAGGVTINGQTLSSQDIEQLQMFGIQVNSGDYWYDAMCGAWGYAGGPTMGFLTPGISVGGTLQAGASNGNTGVFVNGRNLPIEDLLALQSLTGPLAPGRYFIDQYGNGGYEGGPAVINLRQAAAQQGSGSWQSGVTGASGNSSGGSGYVILKDSLGRPSTVGY